MRRFFLVLPGLLAVLGCDQDRDPERVALVEVVSQPSGLLMSVSVGFDDLVTFEAETPIRRDVRSKASCSRLTDGNPMNHLTGCQLVAIASVKNGDATGVRIVICLGDAGVRECATGNDGKASVTIEFEPDDR